jgi:hypothetical protein
LDCRERIGQILDARLRSKVSARDVRQNVRDFLTAAVGLQKNSPRGSSDGEKDENYSI